MRKFLFLMSLMVCCFVFLVLIAETHGSSTSVQSTQSATQYDLVDIQIYTKNQTNSFGAVIHTDEWIRYSFINNGNIETRDRNFEGMQKGRYRIHASADGAAKIVDSSDYSNASLDFYLTEDMYKGLYFNN